MGVLPRYFQWDELTLRNHKHKMKNYNKVQD